MDDNNDNDYEILTDEYTEMDLSFKIIVIGDSGVGKSCLSARAVNNNFDKIYAPTICLENYILNVRIKDKKIKLQIWDTCGQEIYRSLVTSFYRNSSLAILTYAINSKESFINIEKWLNELKINSNPEIKIFLIGTKSDLIDSREVSTEEATKFCDEHKLDYFIETSAKEGFNVKNVFIEAARELYNMNLLYKDRGSRAGSVSEYCEEKKNFSNFLIDDEKKGIQKKGSCC